MVFTQLGQTKVLPPGGGSGMVPMPALTMGVGSDGNPLALRPVYDVGAGALSWQGPLGGGPSNGDYTLQNLRLTNVGGSVSSSGANTTIEGKYATGNPAISINHNNVTLRRCFGQVTPANTDNAYCVVIATGVTGTIIEDCYFDGQGDSNEGNGIGGGSLAPPTVSQCTVRRCHFFQCGQAIRYVVNNISFSENYCHKVAGADADWFECYPNGGSNDHLTIQYNVFAGPDDSVAGSDSGVNFTTGSGLPAGNIGPNILVDSNWFVWDFANTGAWQFHSIVNDCDGATGSRLEFTFTNNGIFNKNGTPSGGGSILFGSASSGSATASGGGLVHDSGNYVMGTTTARTGTLYAGANGAGRL
jgi:hypothetical protein